jgi:hypothetical protein
MIVQFEHKEPHFQMSLRDERLKSCKLTFRSHVVFCAIILVSVISSQPSSQKYVSALEEVQKLEHLKELTNQNFELYTAEYNTAAQESVARVNQMLKGLGCDITDLKVTASDSLPFYYETPPLDGTISEIHNYLNTGLFWCPSEMLVNELTIQEFKEEHPSIARQLPNKVTEWRLVDWDAKFNIPDSISPSSPKRYSSHDAYFNAKWTLQVNNTLSSSYKMDVAGVCRPSELTPFITWADREYDAISGLKEGDNEIWNSWLPAGGPD